MQIKPLYSQFLVGACVLGLQNATWGRQGWVLWKTRLVDGVSIHPFIHSFTEFLPRAWLCVLGTRNTDACCNEASLKDTTLQLAGVNPGLSSNRKANWKAPLAKASPKNHLNACREKLEEEMRVGGKEQKHQACLIQASPVTWQVGMNIPILQPLPMGKLRPGEINRQDLAHAAGRWAWVLTWVSKWPRPQVHSRMGWGVKGGPQLHLILLLRTGVMQSHEEGGVGFLIVPVLQMRIFRLREALNLLKVTQQKENLRLDSFQCSLQLMFPSLSLFLTHTHTHTSQFSFIPPTAA